MTPTEPDSFSLLRVILAFAVVFGLLGALGFGLRSIAGRGIKLPGKLGRAKRLELVESLPLDIRRRLVIVRCDGNEHLLLLGQNQDIVVAGNVKPNPPPLGEG
jgi:flagellar protein FliO/FliZ